MRLFFLILGAILINIGFLMITLNIGIMDTGLSKLFRPDMKFHIVVIIVALVIWLLISGLASGTHGGFK